jgi:hypothetical protein
LSIGGAGDDLLVRLLFVPAGVDPYRAADD